MFDLRTRSKHGRGQSEMPKMRDDITVLTTTHFVKSCPSTRLLQETLSSFAEASGPLHLRHLISYDMPKACSDMHLQYLKNIRSLRDQYGRNVEVSSVNQLGLFGSFLHLIEQVDTPYLIFLEHDWIFREVISLKQLLHVFNKYDFVKHVRFNKRSNIARRCDIRVEPEPRISELALTRTWCFSNNPYMARTELIRDQCLPIIQGRRQRYRGSRGIEQPVDRTIKRQVGTEGFDVTHQRWGTYLYGSVKAPPTVQHLDGNAFV